MGRKKQFAIVSNLRFSGRTNFMLSYVEDLKKKKKKSLITSGQTVVRRNDIKAT